MEQQLLGNVERAAIRRRLDMSESSFAGRAVCLRSLPNNFEPSASSLRTGGGGGGGYVSIRCKYNSSNGRHRRPASAAGKKSVQERQKEFAERKEELLRKSRGGTKQSEEELGTALLMGARSVPALQPIADESYYPAVGRESFSLSHHGLDNSHLNVFSSEFVAQASSLDHQVLDGGEVNKKKHLESATARIEHTVTSRKDEERADDDDDDDSSDSRNIAADEDEFEWVEVEDEEEDERVEYWEGDLPPMTPEEEEELLREAGMELSEIEKLEDDRDLEEMTLDSDSERIHMERKLAGLKGLVQKMEEQLAGGGEGGPEHRPRPPSSISEGSTQRVVKEIARKFEVHDDNTDRDLNEDEYRQSSGYDEICIESKRVNIHYKSQRRDYWEGDGEEEEVVKEDRGVPAVMRCFDRAKIYVKAGDGGNGVVAFRREKFVPFGGPFGGNGGRGGNVYVEADSSMNSLLPFRKAVHFRAGRGSHGGGKRKEGAAGTDCTVKVPPGTLIAETGPGGKVLLEMIKPGQRTMLLPGGTGGRGNAAFKSGRNNAPQLAELGEEGAEMWIDVELKLVADVGIVGVPNAGKSTFLSAISAAKPEIANYPFTTLLPNLGVVALDYDATMVVADLPGLLEGAHTGIGLGHEFLRHTERCRVLVHVVDGMSLQPVEEFEAVRLELQLFNPVLSEKPFVVAFNKMDNPEAADRWDAFQQHLRLKGVEPFCMSAISRHGTSEVISAAHDHLKLQKGSDIENFSEDKTKETAVAEMVRQQRSAPIENFTIEEDKHTRTWQVTGAGLERFTQMTNWEYFEAVRRFQRVLSASGVNKALREKGIREGDTVIVAQMEFKWIDSEDMSALADWKRGIRGSKVWPH